MLRNPGVVVALVATLAGCDGLESLVTPGGSGTAAPADEATLIVGRGADALGLDPARQTDNESIEVCEQIYEGLVRYAPAGAGGGEEIEPALATRWEVSEGGRIWTFELRPGVRFHDGTPLDAAAVVFSFERQRDPAHPAHSRDFLYWQNIFRHVKKVEAAGPMSVRITIDRPYAPFLASLGTFPVTIVSPAAAGTPGELPYHPVGTGPFRFVSWVPGDRIILERNEDYWGRHANLARLVFRVMPDPHERLEALEGGSIDVAYELLPEEIQYVELHPQLRLLRMAGQNVSYLAMNTLRPPFDDPAVRRAVNHAVNKAPIVKLVYQGLAVAASGPLPPTMWGHREPALPDQPYDPARARALLAEARARKKLDPARRYRLYVARTPRPYLPDPERVGRVLKRHLAEVGVQTDLIVQDFGAHRASIQSGEHDLCLYGWAADYPDPDNFLQVLFDRENTTPGIARNLAFYRDDEVSELLGRAQAVQDRSEREKLYLRVQERLADQAPWVPLAHAEIHLAARADVIGLALQPSSHVRYDAVRRRR